MLETLRVVFVKEMRDLLRDRRTLFFLFGPPLMLPLLAIAALMLITWQVERQAPEGLTIAVSGGEYAPDLLADLERVDMLRLVELPADPAAELRSGTLAALLVIPPDTQARLAAELPVTLTLTTSRVGWMPMLADTTIRDAIADYEQDLLAERLARHGLDAAWMEPLRLAQAEAPTAGIVAPPSQAGSADSVTRSLNGLMVPFLVSSWSLGGGLGLIAYMTVGEKEHRTMEPLLITAADRMGIVLGKMSVSMIVSLITVALWGIYGLGYLLLFNLTAMVGVEQPVGSGPQLQAFGVAGVWLLLLMIPLMTMTSGLTAAVCTFARNYREASLFTTVLQLGLPVVSFAAVFIAPATPNPILYALPFFGILVAVRDLFLQGLSPWMLALTGLTSIVYAVLSILLASYVFSREGALMRGL
ncbi:MAG: ABC transporter permease [Anaerolineae bacterium]|nr:ABC transporter permease [Anaerolineae bacterium]